MVLESTMICVDNSEFMRNEDFQPGRLNAQEDIVRVICRSKIRSNPENNVGLLKLANTKVLSTLTADVGRISSKLNQLQPEGAVNVLTGIRIAHMVLKHREGKNHRTRIVVILGSPINFDEQVFEFGNLARKLKKEKVNVDIICLGEENGGTDVLTHFINTLNGKEGTDSHLITIPPRSDVSGFIPSIIQEEKGTGAGGFESLDLSDDPDLALALRISMEEARQQQGVVTTAATSPSSDNALLASADPTVLPPAYPDFSTMTEDEQIAYALQFSMQDSEGEASGENESMEEEESIGSCTIDDYEGIMNDPVYLKDFLDLQREVGLSSDTVRSIIDEYVKSSQEEDQEETSDSE